jgi:hypothetical protein
MEELIRIISYATIRTTARRLSLAAGLVEVTIHTSGTYRGDAKLMFANKK